MPMGGGGNVFSARKEEKLAVSTRDKGQKCRDTYSQEEKAFRK